jgi:hypothetical protein
MNDRYNTKGPNLNFEHDKVVSLINELLYKGQILEWKEKSTSNYFRDNWGKFKVTSVKINSWGSIYVNLRLIDGEYYNRPLINEFTEQKTQYKNNQTKNQWKWHTLSGLVYNQVKLMGIPGGKIFIKRLTLK